jgi:uncharacterized membrane-anchored protein
MLNTLNHTAKKVPEITAFFWIIKILTTAMGEAASDFSVKAISPSIAVGLGACGLIVALVLQFTAKTYQPWRYWFAVSMVAIFGTMVADVLHVGLGVPYIVSSIFFGISLAIIFFAWYKKEHTLSIHSIYTARRETFYWLTVMATFALGTATGDLTAFTLGIGYFASGLLFIILIAIPLLAYAKFGLKEVAAFWIAYILTRPLGASFADYFGKPQSIGGLGLGDSVVGLILAVCITGLVIYITLNRREVRREHQSYAKK